MFKVQIARHNSFEERGLTSSLTLIILNDIFRSVSYSDTITLRTYCWGLTSLRFYCLCLCTHTIRTYIANSKLFAFSTRYVSWDYKCSSCHLGMLTGTLTSSCSYNSIECARQFWNIMKMFDALLISERLFRKTVLDIKCECLQFHNA